MGVDYTEPGDVPDEPRLPRPPDRAPPPLSDSADREETLRSYKDLVDAAYADQPQGTSDTTGPSSNDAPALERKKPPLLRAAGEGQQDGDAAVVEADGHVQHKAAEKSPYCDVAELKGDEPASAERLMEAREFTGVTLQGFKEPTGNPDYIDKYKRTYDQIGGPLAWTDPQLSMNAMINQIRRHVYEKVGHDFTVLDLTGASSHQIDEVFENLDKWEADPAKHPLNRLIILGDDF